MLKIGLAEKSEYRILCLGAHSDDIEIGCGGTILRLLQELADVSVYWVVFSAHAQRADEATTSAHAFLAAAKDRVVVVKNFRDGFFPYTAIEIKEYFEELKHEFHPDVVFTHYREDRHQDHRLISDLTWNTFRDHLVLEYEIPKYDGDLGIPNIFVHLDETICRQKVQHLIEHFGTQANKHWFSNDTFLGLLRLRGMESNSPSGYAEAFYGRKVAF